MGIRAVILLVIYGPQIQVGLQLAVGTLDFAGQVVIVPGGLLVKRGDVRAEEIEAAVPIHVIRHGNALAYVCHVPRVCFVGNVVDDIVLYGWVFLPCSAHSLYDFFVCLCAVLFRE